jgi:hypothetical protein
MHYNAEETRISAARKLHPDVVKIGPFCHTILACLLGENWFPMSLLGIHASKNGKLWGRFDGNLEPVVLCDRQVLVNSIMEIAEGANLTPRERAYILENIPAASRTVRDRKTKNETRLEGQ